MRTARLAALLALCGVLAIGTPEARAGKGWKGKGHGKPKHYGGIVGLPPGHGGIPPGHGGIPPGQAKKMYGPVPRYAPLPFDPGFAPAYGYPSYGGLAPISTQPAPAYGGYVTEPYPVYGGSPGVIPLPPPGGLIVP